MKKQLVYALSLWLWMAAAGAYGQTAIKKSKAELAEAMIFRDELLLFAQKEAGGQFIYGESLAESGRQAYRKGALNAGHINAPIGKSADGNQLFVYQKNGRDEEKIAVYTWGESGFRKTGERPLPKMMNHSYNLNLFLTEDKQHLFISAELAKRKGYEDIYLSKWENNRWTKPENLGKLVNTRGSEFAPFVANDSLFFSRKEQEQVTVYAVALDSALSPRGEAVPLHSTVNQELAYNAYYKRTGEAQVWIRRDFRVQPGTSEYVVYLHRPNTTLEALLPLRQVQITKAMVRTAAGGYKNGFPSLTFYHDLNQYFLETEEMLALHRFLAAQPEGTRLRIMGYSDKFGDPVVREKVGRERAQYVKNFIDNHYAHKHFNTSLELTLLNEGGVLYRRTELYLGNASPER